MKLEPVSLFAGAALLGLTLAGTGAVQTPSSKTAVRIPAPATAFGGNPIPVAGIPDPHDIFVIEEGAPFTVPPGMSLVVTAVGTNRPNTNVVWLQVDGPPGVVDIASAVFATSTSPATMVAVPPHLVIPTGSVVEPVNNATGSPSYTGRAYAYLIEE